MLGLAFNLMLAVHVAGGTLALLAGPVAMAARKGRALHRMSGRAYAIAMAGTAASALVLAVATRDLLLLVIAVFSFFLVFNGWRALSQRRLHEGQGARWFDWLVSGLTLAFSAGLLADGLAGDGDVTTLFFGAGGSFLAIRELRVLTGRISPGGWLVRHVTGMSAAYIATVSAFAVVTLTFLPRPVAFIAPTLIGTPMIAWVVTRLIAASRRDVPLATASSSPTVMSLLAD